MDQLTNYTYLTYYELTVLLTYQVVANVLVEWTNLLTSHT